MNQRDKELWGYIEKAKKALRLPRTQFVGQEIAGKPNIEINHIRYVAGSAYDIARALENGKKGTNLPKAMDGENTLSYGLAATSYVGSDRYPYTLVGWLTPRILFLAPDKYTRTDENGQSEQQEYAYETNPEALPEKAVWSAQQRCYQISKGARVHLGTRLAYFDPSF